MKYMGSKLRIAKYILPIILKDRKMGQYYVEPFCGGCNTLDKVSNPRIGNDNNPYLIAMWRALQQGWMPPKNIDREYYHAVRLNKCQYPDYLVGYVGFCCSYSGKWFGGYAGVTHTKIGTVRDYIDESHRNLIEQTKRLVDVKFTYGDYTNLSLPHNSIVYCDPPYEGVTGYHKSFDHSKFWDWCRSLSRDGHRVFVSEYKAPSDFSCVWTKAVKSSLSANGQYGGSKESIEKLFTYKS